jgi:protein involved in polysaccharide export with SLBB domain
MLVKRIPNWQTEKFVTISGEVLYPGKYVIKKGEPLSSLIERAGGYTDKAFLRGAVFRRDSVRELQQKGMEEVIKRMERELLAAGTSVSTAISAEEIAGKKVELEQKTKFIANLRELKALGRMSIGLTSLRLLKKSPYDIQLEDGDSLDIPPRPSVVNVTGAVMSQGSFIYSDKLNYRDYIDLAGGFASYANQNNTYILKVDGSAKRVASGFLNWSDNRSRWELAGFAEEIKEIEPGDMIVVPEKLERIAWLREIKDITQILMQTAVTAGVVIKLF